MKEVYILVLESTVNIFFYGKNVYRKIKNLEFLKNTRKVIDVKEKKKCSITNFLGSIFNFYTLRRIEVCFQIPKGLKSKFLNQIKCKNILGFSF